MASGCRKVQPFATMQWQHNQLSNNGNLAIYLSISREHPAAAAFSTALVARSLSLSREWLWKLFTFVPMHAFFYLLFLTLITSHSMWHFSGPFSTPNVICAQLNYCFSFFFRSEKTKIFTFMVRFNFFLHTYYPEITVLQNALVAIFRIYISF